MRARSLWPQQVTAAVARAHLGNMAQRNAFRQRCPGLKRVDVLQTGPEEFSLRLHGNSDALAQGEECAPRPPLCAFLCVPVRASGAS